MAMFDFNGDGKMDSREFAMGSTVIMDMMDQEEQEETENYNTISAGRYISSNMYVTKERQKREYQQMLRRAENTKPEKISEYVGSWYFWVLVFAILFYLVPVFFAMKDGEGAVALIFLLIDLPLVWVLYEGVKKRIIENDVYNTDKQKYYEMKAKEWLEKEYRK